MAADEGLVVGRDPGLNLGLDLVATFLVLRRPGRVVEPENLQRFPDASDDVA
jgi:hypothetical protein